MKKFIYGAIMIFAVQTGFAQTQDAKTFVNNTVNTEAIKQQILPMIDTAKVDDFNKEFDALVNGFVTDFSKLVDENFDAADLKAVNKKFADTKDVNELGTIQPKDKATFEQKAGALSNEVNMTMQGLVMKYASAEVLQQAQE